jgi:lysozyme
LVRDPGWDFAGGVVVGLGAEMTPAVTLCLPLTKFSESCILHPYQDGVGVWTIGWGATAWNGAHVTAETPGITQDEADADLVTKLTAIEAQVRKLCVALADHECAALIDFAYNLGIGALAASTLLRLLNGGDRVGAADQFPSWVYAGGQKERGLEVRRASERAMFLGAPVATSSLLASETTDASDALNAAELTNLNT